MILFEEPNNVSNSVHEYSNYISGVEVNQAMVAWSFRLVIMEIIVVMYILHQCVVTRIVEL